MKTSDGKEKVEDEHMDLPVDLANGLIPVLLKNVQRDALPFSVSFVAATPKPRLVKVAVRRRRHRAVFRLPGRPAKPRTTC